MGSDYEKNFQALCSNPFDAEIAYKYRGRPLDEIMEHIYEELPLFESSYLLSGRYCMVYPNIKYQKAAKNYMCYFSNDLIKKGERYLRYDPLVIATPNPDNRKLYKAYKLSNMIICRSYYEWYLPEDITELDQFAMNIEDEVYDSEVNYRNLSYHLGQGLVLKPIKK